MFELTVEASFNASHAITVNAVPEGTHAARCISVVDIGTQYAERFDTWKRQLVLTWEVPAHTYDGGEDGQMPMTISKFYTLSMNPKANLFKDVTGWRGRKLTDHEVASRLSTVALAVHSPRASRAASSISATCSGERIVE